MLTDFRSIQTGSGCQQIENSLFILVYCIIYYVIYYAMVGRVSILSFEHYRKQFQVLKDLFVGSRWA